MAQRIEVASKILDTRAEIKKKQLNNMGFSVDDVELADVYTFDTDFENSDLVKISETLSNGVFQKTARTIKPKNKFGYVVEVGFLPGVTDNIGNTARESIEDSLNIKLDGQAVYSSQMMFLSGDISKKDIEVIGSTFANPVIQRSRIKNYDQFVKDNGMGVVVPKVDIKDIPVAGLVKILDMSDEELKITGKAGIFDHNEGLTEDEFRKQATEESIRLGEFFESEGAFFKKTRRGPLALDLTYMRTIQNYFAVEGRNPTDLELESIAQTWSEHCKHTIFADPIDNITDGLYKTFIKASTQKIRQQKGDKDFCVSVFSDNSGITKFDENHNICSKVETHNAPSALDPYGGSGTGIVGVNRDPMGTGLGAKDFLNLSGPFCFGDPNDKSPLYKGENFTQKMLTRRQILDGVVEGVKDGGNCSGIPTSHFRMIFDQRYKGKPLVYVGTIGIMPNKSAGRLSHEKKANPGDLIVMVGGRVGKDGIHGATFSSEAMDSGSPMGAVQICDPITQKKMSDALVKEARDLKLYTSITDNGAGGLSCSVAEMARESGGCYVNLDKVPLKYPGLQPWEIWISESQERMTLSVPAEKWNEFSNLMQRRGVEATAIGRFTDSGKCVVDYYGKDIMDVDMDFLHDGLPKRPMKTTYTRKKHEEPSIPILEDLTSSLHSMLRRQNIASIEFISKQFDHEVQGGSVIKPLQGKGRVNGDATITKPVLDSQKGVVVAQGINPTYSDIDTYHMAACAIDTAIRNAVATGADLEHMALLDNFCWCSSDEPERLGQLKEAVRACYDYSISFGTPFVSGKDSMFNDFKGFNEKGEPVKISVPPTLLVTSVGVMKDVRKAVSLDTKYAGDLVYVLGMTHNELGGSEYFSMVGEQQRGKRYVGVNVPKVDENINKKLYHNLSKAMDEELVASSISVGIGGLGVALAKTSIGGRLGMEVSLGGLSEKPLRDDFTLYSESQGRFVVTIDPKNEETFKQIMGRNFYTKVGVVKEDDRFVIKGNNSKEVVDTSLNSMERSYKSTFKDY